MILTKSMFKGFGWMTENGLTWAEYLNRCQEYNYAYSSHPERKKAPNRYRKNPICKRSGRKIKKVFKNPRICKQAVNFRLIYCNHSKGKTQNKSDKENSKKFLKTLGSVNKLSTST